MKYNFASRHVWAACAAVVATSQADASLVLDTSVTTTFSPYATSTNTRYNDLPLPRPSTIYFGQLMTEASTAGVVDFFYIGNEAGYTNTLWVGNSAHSTYNLTDRFNAPYPQVGSLDAGAGSFLDFGFCTSGGDSLAYSGLCAQNDDARSLTEQFNYGGVGGYRSIGFAPLASFNPLAQASWRFAEIGFPSDLWMILWDDSGAQNDDNHDDYIAVARFRRVAVSEPGTLALLAAGLLGLAFVQRRRRARA